MNDVKPAQTTEPTPVTATRRRRWRRPLIWAGVMASVIAVVATLVIAGPRYAARYLADRYFAGIGIDVDGVKTIDIDLPNGEVSLGPVRFYTSQSVSPGEVGELGVKFSLANLFDRQALLERVLVRNVNIAIRQAEDGEFFVNGVALRQILAERTSPEPAKPAAEDGTGSAWGAGIDDLGLRDINVSFTNQQGGTATLHLDYLDLRDFRSWEPDRAGTFALGGTLNGVEVNASGSAQPFAEKISAQIEFAVDGATLASVEQWTGPLGLSRQAGGVNLYARSGLTIFPGGRIEGTANGPLVLSNIDVASPELGEVRLDQGSLSADAAFVLDEQGNLQVSGPFALNLNQADVRRPDGLTLTLASTSADLQEVAAGLSAAGALSLAARPKLQVDQLALTGPAGVSAEKILVEAPQVTFSRDAQGAMTAAAPLRVTVQQPAVDGPAEVRLESIALQAERLDVTQSADGKTGASAALTLGAGPGSLALPAEAGGGMRATFAGLSLALPGTTVALDAGQTRVDGGAKAELTALTAEIAAPAANARPGAAPAPPQRFGAERVAVELPALSAELAQPRTTLAAAMTAAIERLTATLPGNTREADLQLAVDTTTLGLTDTRLVLEGEAMQADGRLDATLARISGGIGAAAATVSGAAVLPVAAPAPSTRPAGRRAVRPAAAASAASPVSMPAGPPGALRGLVDGLEVRLAPISLRTAGEATSLQTTGEARVSRVQAVVPPSPTDAPFEIGMSTLRLGLDRMQVALRGADTTADGGLSASIDGLSAVQAGSAGPTRMTLQKLQLTLAETEARTQGDDVRAQAAGALELESFSAELPPQQGNPTLDASLGRLRTRIDRATFAQTPRGSEWAVTCDAVAERLATAAEKGRTANGTLRTLTVGGFQANSRQQAEVERAVLDRLDALLTRAYLEGTARTEESRAKQAAEAVQQAAEEGWKFRLGSLGLTNGGAIRVRDDSVRPAANFLIGVNTLQLQNVDSGRPEERLTLRLDSTINEFSELAVSGWASPFNPQPSFDMTVRLQRLELPPLSPYAAQAVGVNVESGRLSADVAAAADTGKLDGMLDLTVRDLGFSPLSAADAERLSASVGVPIGTIVGLLQDDEGRIQLKLPVSGDLQNPSFDLTDAIQQTVAGALQAAVLAPFQLAFAPVGLIAEATGVGGGGGGMRFEPVPFEAGREQLGGAASDQLAGLGRVLAERDKLRLQVCGRATAADLAALLAEQGAAASGPRREQAVEALRPVLEALAGKRTAEARAALIREGRAQPQQVGECRSAYDPADDGSPRADVALWGG